MKITSALLVAVVAVAVVLTASTASALPTTSLPLKLMSVSGTMYITANYGSSVTATSNPYQKVSFNYKTVLTLISNQVYLNTAFGPTGPVFVPKNVDVVFDPVSLQTYLTNNLGFYYQLSDGGALGNIAYAWLRDPATSFKGDFYAGSENDLPVMGLVVIAYGTDGLHYEIVMSGTGKLTANYGGKLPAILTKTSTVTMTLSLQNGSGYAEYQGSDDGVITDGQFTFSGSGQVPADVFPYSAWLWNRRY